MDKVQDKLVSKAIEYADLLVKGSLEQLGGVFSDTIGYWRLRNKANLILRAKKLLQAKGVNPESISPDIFVSIVEEGGGTSDETLSGMFSSLLASHIDKAKQNSVHPSFSRVLSQLSSTDAHLLSVYKKYASYKDARDIGLTGSGLYIDYISNELCLSLDDAYLSSLNLERLGLIQYRGNKAQDYYEGSAPYIQDSIENNRYQISEYGIVFLAACNYK